MARIYRLELVANVSGSNVLVLYTQHYQTDVAVGGSEGSAADRLDDILEHYSSSGQNMSYWAAAAYSDTQLVRAVLRQEVEPGSGDVPETAEKPLAIVGTIATPASNREPTPLCAWISDRTNVALRAARGGTHSPPVESSSTLSTSGTWTTGTWWTAIGALAEKRDDAIIDYDAFGSDLLPVVYSRTRRARGQEPYTFQVVDSVVSTVPRWLRRRMTAP